MPAMERALQRLRLLLLSRFRLRNRTSGQAKQAGSDAHKPEAKHPVKHTRPRPPRLRRSTRAKAAPAKKHAPAPKHTAPKKSASKPAPKHKLTKTVAKPKAASAEGCEKGCCRQQEKALKASSNRYM